MSGVFNKGSNTTTQTTGPNAAAMGAYQNLLSRAQGVSQLPYQGYGGEMVAPFNAQQNLGVGNINANANFASPYIQQAAGFATNAAQPLTAGNINQYMSPYIGDVVNATQASFNNANQQQLQNVKGNAIAQGALGGDREAIAEAVLSGQQQAAQAPVIAGLYNQGYGQASQMALAEQQNLGQAAYSLGNLGVAGQNAALQGAGAQYGVGAAQQQTQQALDSAQQQEFMRQQAFPYQQAQWLAGVDTGVGSQMGGTSTTTPPPPNPWGQIAGGALTAAALLVKDGGRVPGFDLGGTVPYGVAGYIPSVGITGGGGAPKAPGTPNQPQQQPDAAGMFKNAATIAKGLKPGDTMTDNPDMPGGQNDILGSAGVGVATPDAWTWARGGRVPGFGRGGLALPSANRIELKNGGPIRAGFGMGSFVPHYRRGGFADGGGDTFADRFGDSPFSDRFGAAYDTLSAPDATPVPIPTPRPAPAGVAPEIDATDIVLPSNVGLGEPWSGTNPALAADAGLPAQSAPTGGVGAPLAYAPPSGGAGVGSPGAATSGPLYAPEGASKAGGFGLNLTGANLSDNARMGLMAAGLGMMASKSPFLGVAIGEGGLAGLSTYAKQKQEQQNLDLEVKKLAQQADIAQKHLALQSRHYEQMTPAEQAHIDEQRRSREVPVGYRKTDAGLEVVPGGPADPSVLRSQAMAKRLPGMDDEALQTMVQSYRAGNTGVLQGIGRGVQGPENLQRFWSMLAGDLKNEGATGRDLAAAKANFTAQSAAARTSATREANVAAAVEEARGTFPLARQASAGVPRTTWVPVNRAIQMWQSGTSSPELAKFAAANQAAITAYAQAMSRTGVTSVNAQHHAEALFDTARGPEAYNAVLDQLEQEMQMALSAPEKVRERILGHISGRSDGNMGGTATPATAAPIPPGAHVGEERPFKQGVGVWNGTAWVPKGTQ